MNSRKTISRLVLIMGVWSGAVVQAQNEISALFKSYEERGDEQFAAFAYQDAIGYYTKAHDTEKGSDSISIKIAESYRMLNDPEGAESWYAQAFEGGADASEPIHMLHYADVLTSNQKYTDAKSWYQRYGEAVGTDGRPQEKLSGIENRKNFYKRVGDIEVGEVAFNSAGTDFSPAFLGDELVFVSSRQSKSAIKQMFNWDNSNFLDLFIANKEGNVRRFSQRLNTKYHEGPLVFFNDGQSVIFTRNNMSGWKVKRNEEGITKLKLYMATRIDSGQWSKAIPLPFNNDNYSVGHPAITKDGSTLYFVSDMPGGIGGTDLYKCEFSNDSAWSAPINLGDKINTEGNEMFPFLKDGQQLYFASNGHAGLGGLDIYYVDLFQGEKAKVVNVGAPINSNLDDFGIIIEPDGQSGYFSSNRNGSKNQDDIFSFDAKKGLSVNYIVQGKVIDAKEMEPVSRAKVFLLDENGKVLEQVEADSEGSYEFSVEEGRNYQVKAKSFDYFEQQKRFNTVGDGKTEWEVDIPLDKDYGFSLYALITDKQSGEPIEGAQIMLIDNMSGQEIFNSPTDKNGEISHPLENKRLQDRISYQVKLSREGYLSKTVTYNGVLDKPGRINLHEVLNIKLDKIGVGTDIGKLINIQPIYFDLGKYNIRSDAAIELDKIVKIMKENPTLTIELGAHTDARGSSGSNLRLSDKRAKASAQYIVSQGIESIRISGRGYGEAHLINRCKDGVSCSEEEHQKNRRTEFRVVKF